MGPIRGVDGMPLGNECSNVMVRENDVSGGQCEDQDGGVRPPQNPRSVPGIAVGGPLKSKSTATLVVIDMVPGRS